MRPQSKGCMKIFGDVKGESLLSVFGSIWEDDKVTYLLRFVETIALVTLAEDLELVFMVDVGLFFLVRVREEMLDIRIILVIIGVNIPNDVKAELTQIPFGKKQ
eukprot:14977067-Ditylum_brightwellii.AAC.3